MDEIHHLYNNDYGIAFRWKHHDPKERKKIQLVFNDLGFSLTTKNFNKFLKNIRTSLAYPPICDMCEGEDDCKSYVLETPSSMISLAVSYIELKKLEELLEGALFQIEMDNLLGTDVID
ncbi:MAG: hypothetical protein AAF617_03225 [Bacteroidota bacterium]